MKMRKLTLLPAVIAVSAAVALFSTSCGNPSTHKFTTDSISFNDSAFVGLSRAYCSMNVDYPVTGNRPLIDSVSLWIGRQLAMAPNFTSDSTDIPDYSRITDGSQLLRTAGTFLLAETKIDMEEYARDSITVNFEFNWDIRPLCDSTRFVTYASSTYFYLGGAHGSSGFAPATFDKASGHIFGWDIIVPDSLPALQKLVKARLLTEFFNAPSYNDIRDALLVNPDTLPLPATPPCFLTDGVDFTYMQYEIAPYSTGMPSCVIDYHAIRPLLTPQARALLD